ncbi:MAG: hypothetical protein Aurels2KO_49300 [Aureliella sp.]
MLRLHCNDIEIVIENVPHYGTAEGDSAGRFDSEIQLDTSTDVYTTSKHSVTTIRSGEQISSAILLAGGGSSGIHEHSALVLDDDLLIAVGPYIARLSIPSLDAIWTAETDDTTCFGVYYSPTHRLILSHGELNIAALRPDGSVEWSAGGADIFTNGFTLDSDLIYTRDFSDRNYTFDIATGASCGGQPSVAPERRPPFSQWLSRSPPPAEPYRYPAKTDPIVSTQNQVPTQADFDPIGCDLDAQSAWKHFGGLSIDQAFVRFCENSLCYQEDFMSMGTVAFAYYSPMLEKFLHNVPDIEHDDDNEAWIISRGIVNQFDSKDSRKIEHLKDRVIDLAIYVLDNIDRLGADDEERKRVSDSWQQLIEQLKPN